MDLYPAIDVRNGRCVRLYQGDYDQETVYADDPVAVASGFAAAGARWIHVVDLDAARTGEPVNRAVIEAVCAAVAGMAEVQAGGGVRSDAAAFALAEAGVARVVVGTAALEDPGFVERLARRQRVAVGLDGRRREGAWELAVRGWRAGSGQDLFAALRRFEGAGVDAVIVTEIGRDGTLLGPDTEAMAEVLEASALPVIASGGVAELGDVRALAGLQAGGRRLAGAIVGRALYTGAFGVADALAAASEFPA